MTFTDEDYEAIIHHSNSSYIREMVELLGLERTLLFVKKFEGQTVLIPKFNCRRLSGLRQLLIDEFGGEFAESLSFYFSQCSIYVMSVSTAIYKAGIKKRNREICDKAEALIRAGVTIRQIIFEFAHEYDVSDRQISNILSGKA
ncbi:hypothetical protein ACRT4E_000789 [Pseudomonas aeruginosa]|nr:hypothetical protein [Pseudomonas aeruginosa]